MTIKSYEDNHKEFTSILEEGAILRYRKMYDYGMSYKKHGSFGLLVRITDKLARLNNLIKKENKSVHNESLEDTAIDVMNYSAMLVMELREEKRKRSR